MVPGDGLTRALSELYDPDSHGCRGGVEAGVGNADNAFRTDEASDPSFETPSAQPFQGVDIL